MEYVITPLENSVVIGGVYTVHYFEYTKDFTYSGEIHNFWELVYADKRSLLITAGSKEVKLDLGQLYIHKPNEFHKIRCDGEHAANSVILSFGCDSGQLSLIAGRVITCNSEQKRLIGAIIRESRLAFATPLGSPYIRVMTRAEDPPLGCEQLIRMYIEQLLILLLRGSSGGPLPAESGGDQLKEIVDFLEDNVFGKLRFSDVMNRFNLSASVLKRMFREHMDCGVMEYFQRLKVDAAKQMIREKESNFTEIAERLSFSSSQYFTTVFRRVSGMTPSEYSKSVRE